MNENFVRERITQLRLQQDLSEYQLSYDLGHSKGYINNISSGKAMPSMSELLNICDYFHITPKEFFDTELEMPVLAGEIISKLPHLSDADLKLVLSVVNRCCQ